MILTSKTSDFNFLGFLLGIACCVLMGINLVIAHTGFANIYFMAFSLISMVLVLTNCLGSAKPAAVFFLILSFPEYGASPYDLYFFSPFYFQKYVMLLLCIRMFNMRIRFDTIFYIMFLFLSWLSSFYYGINGAVANEIIQLFILVCLLNIQFDDTSQKLIMSFLLSFIAFCFISSIIINLFGIAASRVNGGEVYFFGHWFGILVGYFIVNIGKVRYPFSYKLILVSLFIISLYVNINTFQSAHFVFVVLCLFSILRLFERITFRSVGWVGTLVLGFYLIQSANWNAVGLTGEFAWVFMKGIQLLDVLAFDLSKLGNSPLIRLNEILSLFQQSNLIQLAFGRGFASTYEISGAYWELSNLHGATFPLEQINGGALQMVHESLVLLFKWTGVLGVVAVLFILIRRLRREGLNAGETHFILILVALFLLSGVHTGLLCLMLIRYNRQAVI